MCEVAFIIYTSAHDHRCGCDIPAHSYTYSWEGNPQWSRPYVEAAELYEYFKGRAKAYSVDEFVRLQHQVTRASWDDSRGKWIVEIADLQNRASLTDEADVLINGAGFLKYVYPPGAHRL